MKPMACDVPLLPRPDRTTGQLAPSVTPHGAESGHAKALIVASDPARPVSPERLSG